MIAIDHLIVDQDCFIMWDRYNDISALIDFLQAEFQLEFPHILPFNINIHLVVSYSRSITCPCGKASEKSAVIVSITEKRYCTLNFGNWIKGVVFI